MKRIIAILICAALALSSFAACGNAKAPERVPEAGAEKLTIVSTIFPGYDWAVNVLGYNAAGAEVVMLMDNGADLHSYQPTVEDITTISECDLLIYAGGESDEWVEEAVENAVNKDMKVISMLGELGSLAKLEEQVDGMQEHDHEHEHEGEEDHDHEHEEPEYDEHVWLSLRNAAILTQSIADALSELDPDNAKLYAENAGAYAAKLDELDAAYVKAVSEAEVDTLLFGDRFPFRYLVDDYGLSYYAAFAGCSAETEASFETISFLSRKLDELGLRSVIVLESSDGRIADTVIKNSASGDQRILTMDSMQSVTAADVEAGASYISIMEKNLSVLIEALED